MIIYQPGLTSCHVTEGLSPVELNKQKKMNTSTAMCDKTMIPQIMHVYYTELPLKATHCSRLNVGGLLFDMMKKIDKWHSFIDTWFNGSMCI